MAKLPRTTQKIFGKNAPENQITTFGSIKAGTPVYTQSASQIMNSAFEGGWSEAVEDDYAPYRQDRNAVDTAITQQLGYLFQDGIPEWDAGTTYYKGSVVKVVNGNALTFYKSIADNNTASVNTTASWHKMLEINASNQIVSPSINTPTISGGSMSNGTFSNPTFSGTVNVPLASQSSSTDSTIAASIGWVNNPSLSSNVVHKTGNETVGGTKTFTSFIKATSQVDETSTSTQERSYIELWDNQAVTGHIRQYWTTTQNQLRIRALARHGEAAGSWGDIQQIIDSSGNYRVNISCQGTLVNTAVTGATNSTTNGEIPTKGWVNNPDTSTNVVHRSGDETVGGKKTFTAQVTKTNSSATVDTIFVNKNTAITKGTAPSENVESRWRLTDSSTGDSNSALIGGVVFGYNKSMRTSAILQAGKPEAGSTEMATMGIYYPATGDAYTSAPTPATSDNSTKIATTAFVKDVLSTSGNGLCTYHLGTTTVDVVFANGLIIQRGVQSVTSNGVQTVTFPVPFTSTDSYSIVKNMSSSGSSGLQDREGSFYNITTTSAQTYHTTSDSTTFHWLAIGY